MVKVKLYTANGALVTEAVSLPYVSWPQAFYWGQRIFVRENFRELGHETTEPPAYYEITALTTWSYEQWENLTKSEDPAAQFTYDEMSEIAAYGGLSYPHWKWGVKD